MKTPRLLDPLVARTKFTAAFKELHAVKDSYKQIWRLRYAEYPIILIDILSATTGKPSVTLYMNLRNFDFMPPSATLLTTDLRRRLMPENVPAVQDPESGKGHLAGTPDTGLWFCSPGFYEFHDFYYPLDRWELLRYTELGKISWIVNEACNMINRQKISEWKK